LALSRLKKRSSSALSIGFSFPTHAQLDPVALQAPSIALARVVAAAIGVMHQANPRPAAAQGHLEGGLNQSLIAMGIHGIAHEAPRIDVQDPR
jgi:hypothetical protein